MIQNHLIMKITGQLPISETISKEWGLFIKKYKAESLYHII